MEVLTAAEHEVVAALPGRLRESCARHVLVEITDADGTTGWGEWVPGTSVAAAYASAHADLAARRSGLPLALSLSPAAATTLRVNAVLGRYEGAVEAEAAVLNGFSAVKVKVGGASLDADLGRLREIRAALGDGVALRVDANGSWNAVEAERALRCMSSIQVEFVEQPVPASDLASLHALRRRGAVKVVADESVVDAASVDELAGAVDGVMLKVARVGGPHAALRLAERARSHGLSVHVSSLWESGVGHAIGAHTAAAMAADGPCGFADVAEVEGVLPLDVAGGRIELGACIGSGVHLDEEQLR